MKLKKGLQSWHLVAGFYSIIVIAGIIYRIIKT